MNTPKKRLSIVRPKALSKITEAVTSKKVHDILESSRYTGDVIIPDPIPGQQVMGIQAGPGTIHTKLPRGTPEDILTTTLNCLSAALEIITKNDAKLQDFLLHGNSSVVFIPTIDIQDGIATEARALAQMGATVTGLTDLIRFSSATNANAMLISFNPSKEHDLMIHEILITFDTFKSLAHAVITLDHELRHAIRRTSNTASPTMPEEEVAVFTEGIHAMKKLLRTSKARGAQSSGSAGNFRRQLKEHIQSDEQCLGNWKQKAVPRAR